jgi:pSer/pThr/pTyr-binding forkhead associated (FHA) protein
MDVRFSIVSPPRKKGSLNVKLPILIGRSEEVKFRIQQDSVSRRHCEVFIKDGAVYVRDLGSTNGTFLDGEPVTAAVASYVHPGAEIRVGGVVFRVEYESPNVAAVTDDDTASLDTVPTEEPTAEAAEAMPEADSAAAEEDAGEDSASDEAADEAADEQADEQTDEQTDEQADEQADEAAEEQAEESGTAAADPFGGLSAAEPAAASESFGFLPSTEEPVAEADDDNLSDFFKSLK